VLDTSFLNKDNLRLFVEKRVDEDQISGSSSTVLELPKRTYLEDEDFSKELLSQPQDVRIVMGPSSSGNKHDKQMPKQIVIASTSRFLNENMNLFIEGKHDSDNISCSSDVAPELPDRKYLEEDTTNKNPLSPTSEAIDVPNVTYNEERRDIRLRKSDSLSDKYTPLDPSTLQLVPEVRRELTQPYASVTQGEVVMGSQLDLGDYMALTTSTSKSNEGTYMSLRKPGSGRPDSDDDDYEYSYTKMTPNFLTSTLGHSGPK